MVDAVDLTVRFAMPFELRPLAWPLGVTSPRTSVSVSLSWRVTDGPALEAVAAVWREGGWAAEVSGDGIVAPYNAPGTGPPPWQVYRVAARTVFGVATSEPYGATRWRF